MYSDQRLLEHLSEARMRIEAETDDRVRAFLGLRIESVVDEMDRRCQDRIDRRLVAKPWAMP